MADAEFRCAAGADCRLRDPGDLRNGPRAAEIGSRRFAGGRRRCDYQSIDLNFVNYDNDNAKYVYVYAHTKRGTLDLVNQVEQIAKENSGGLPG